MPVTTKAIPAWACNTALQSRKGQSRIHPIKPAYPLYHTTHLSKPAADKEDLIRRDLLHLIKPSSTKGQLYDAR